MVSIYDRIKQIEQKFLRSDLPEFEVGDSIKMKVKVVEADKIRMHPFEGMVISKSGRGLQMSFTVRKVSYGEGIERTFPLNSPVIDSIQVVSKGIVRRSKLYYLRKSVGKSAHIKKQQVQ